LPARPSRLLRPTYLPRPAPSLPPLSHTVADRWDPLSGSSLTSQRPYLHRCRAASPQPHWHPSPYPLPSTGAPLNVPTRTHRAPRFLSGTATPPSSTAS
jgi:hypothetical protein